MKLYGLTGNMGCGKSTVASLLSAYPDVMILDCDKVAKEIILSNQYKEKVEAIVGKNLLPTDQPDFRAIAQTVFQDLEKKRLLETLIHPLVWARVEKQVEA